MPVIYGEGREKALERLREEIDKRSKDKSFSSITSSIKCQGKSGYREAAEFIRV
jgi:hypothetical protein